MRPQRRFAWLVFFLNAKELVNADVGRGDNCAPGTHSVEGQRQRKLRKTAATVEA